MPEAIGLARAFELAVKSLDETVGQLTMLRDYMITELLKHIAGVRLNGHPTQRLCNNVNISLESVETEAALVSLDLAGIECSGGSACASGSLEPSHVLLAMGLPERVARNALRFTMGDTTTKRQLDDTVRELVRLSERANCI